MGMYFHFVGFMRICVAVSLGYIGCIFLAASESAPELVMNSVGLAFVFELDVLIYKACKLFACSANMRKVLEDIDEGLTFRIRVEYEKNENVNERESVGKPVKDTTNDIVCCRRRCSTAVVLAPGIIVYIFILVYCTICLLSARYLNLKTALSEVSSICLLMGPTPNMTSNYGVSFPVPGLCESLLHVKIPQENATEQKYVGSLYQHSDSSAASDTPGGFMHTITRICKSMYQGSNEGSHIAPVRMTDKDLAEIGLTDEAANFWCPTSEVKKLINCDMANAIAMKEEYHLSFRSLLSHPFFDVEEGVNLKCH